MYHEVVRLTAAATAKKYTAPDGRVSWVVNFPAADNYYEGGIRKTDFIYCEWWFHTKEEPAIAKWLTKGKLVNIKEGRPKPEHYVDRNGNIVDALRIKIAQLDLLSPGGGKTAPAASQDEQLPFDQIQPEELPELPA